VSVQGGGRRTVGVRSAGTDDTVVIKRKKAARYVHSEPSAVKRRDIARHLVVLDLLGRSDQREVGRRFIFLLPFGHDLLALLDDPHHALASLRSWLDAEDAEALLEPLDLGFGFLQMRLEQLLQLLGMGRLHILGSAF